MKKKSNSFSHAISEKENIQRLSLDIALLKQNKTELEELQQEINLNPPKKHCSKKALLLASSTLLGIGVGLAMMPIFNEEVEHLENYGINIHSNSTFFAISTINTLLAIGCSTGFYCYNYFFGAKKEEQVEFSDPQKVALNLCKIGGFIGSLVPVGMLWNIELHDQKVEGTDGFDQFIAWATFTTIPLIIFKTIAIFEQTSKYIINNHNNIELDNLGSKIITYGLSSISLIGRGVSLTYVLNELQKQIGLDENISLPISIITGGVIGNITLGLSDYSNLKKLFKTNSNEINYKQLALGLSSALEGGWFALPLISIGLEATGNWNPLLRGSVFTSFFLSHMNSEATHLYHSIIPQHSPEEQQHDEVLLSGESDV